MDQAKVLTMYDIGKRSLDLISYEDSEIKNKIIASQFFDEKTIEKKEFSHCYFSNISFRKSIMKLPAASRGVSDWLRQ